MATRGTITIDNNTHSQRGYDTHNYRCNTILNSIYTNEFKNFLLQIEFTVGGTYNFSSSANGQTCYMYYGNGRMKTFGVINNGRLTVPDTTFSYAAGDVQAHPNWFNRISFGYGGVTSSQSAPTNPNSGGKFHIVMHFNIPDWFVSGEPIAQTNDSAHQTVHRFIQYFYKGTIYVPFRIHAGASAEPFRQEIQTSATTPQNSTIGTTGEIMSATVENTLLYSTYANRTFTYS